MVPLLAQAARGGPGRLPGNGATRGPKPGFKLDMRCRYPGCKIKSKGPRFRFLCEEHLKLPKDKVDLDEKSLARWKEEQEQVKQALAVDSLTRLWQAGFLEPVNGRRTGIFGSVRVMNGQPRNPHNGEDISAPMGADVAATNDGVVRLTVDHFFSGKGIFLDHGLGFYSMYFHLSEVLVKDGESVKAGQIIGRVGATGRATGPHLHWGVKLNGARVNPYALLDLPFQRNGSGPIEDSRPNSVSAAPVSAAPVP